jgi:tetrapyrrole methylase family protein/MazG family protein
VSAQIRTGDSKTSALFPRGTRTGTIHRMDAKISALKRLLEIVEALRGPEGCPWDRAQTLANMRSCILEEACEAVDALDDSDGRPTSEVCEELGDVLMNIFLAAQIAEDQGGFSLAHVASGIAEKLVRRHPHVFGTVVVNDVEDVLRNWNAIKAEEKKAAAAHTGREGTADRPASLLDDVPRSLPLLERSVALGKKAAKVGFDWPDPSTALNKVAEELGEVRALLDGNPEDLEAELGDLLFAVASVCRKLDVRPSTALRRTLNKFRTRFRFIEEHVPDLDKATLDEMERLWQQAKAATSDKEDGCR